jgi:EAL domain-containing protein (putative c-di-GMP-specific phosphodiesterase class I)
VQSAFISDSETAALHRTTLRDAGVTIALDDFGTGYSSLSYLLKLPVDKLKIDRSIAENVDRVKSAANLQAIIALARSIGLKVTAEGVETAQQEIFLTSAGCHYLQSFRIGRPMPAHVIDLALSGKLALAV